MTVENKIYKITRTFCNFLKREFTHKVLYPQKKKKIKAELSENLVKSKEETAGNFLLACSNFGKRELFRNIHKGLHEVRSTNRLTCNKY